MIEFEWNDKELISQVETIAETVCEKGAELIAADMRRKVSVKTGKLKKTIKTKKSEYKNGGYLAGVFYEDSAVWEETLGARAIFVEYGHAAPDLGRGNVKRKDIVKSVPAYPFIRPAFKKNKRKIQKLFERHLQSRSVNINSKL
jgi:HK97 gp10 family phage protein